MSENISDSRVRRSSKIVTSEIAAVHLCGMELSNLFLLRVTAFCFALFVASETIGALASGSLSLLGDASAMSVDVFTYFCNMYSEHVKAKYGHVDKCTKMILQIGIPCFSVCALLGVSAWITVDALDVILHEKSDDHVDVYFLFGFAGANALVDITCAILFYMRRKNVLIEKYLSFSQTVEEGAESPDILNLNMASSLTHVGGDCMRTSSVFVAAIVASSTNVTGAKADAWAAIVVTITIVFLVIPLIHEIYKDLVRFQSLDDDNDKTKPLLEA